jgi:hypothetical protein
MPEPAGYVKGLRQAFRGAGEAGPRGWQIPPRESDENPPPGARVIPERARSPPSWPAPQPGANRVDPGADSPSRCASAPLGAPHRDVPRNPPASRRRQPGLGSHPSRGPKPARPPPLPSGRLFPGLRDPGGATVPYGVRPRHPGRAGPQAGRRRVTPGADSRTVAPRQALAHLGRRSRAGRDVECPPPRLARVRCATAPRLVPESRRGPAMRWWRRLRHRLRRGVPASPRPTEVRDEAGRVVTWRRALDPDEMLPPPGRSDPSRAGWLAPRDSPRTHTRRTP